MNGMFATAVHFNQPLGTWDVSKVITMQGMFDYSALFNQPLSDWDMSNVTNVDRMFYANRGVFCQYLCWDLNNETLSQIRTIGATVSLGPRYSAFVGHGADCECGVNQTLDLSAGHRGVCEGNADITAAMPEKQCASLLVDDMSDLLIHAYILITCFLLMLLLPCLYH
jgi:hypothetical protein